MKRFHKALAKPWAANTFAACCAVLLYLVLSNLPAIGKEIGTVLHAVSPIFIGAIVAYLVNPLGDFFEKKVFKKIKKDSTRHSVGVICAIICFILFVALLLVALIPSLIKSISNLIANWGKYTAMAGTLLKKVEAFALAHNLKVNLTDLEKHIGNAMNSLLGAIKNNSKAILDALGNIGTSISNWVIGILFGFCFLFSENTIVKGLQKIRGALWKKDSLERHDKLLNHCNNIFIRYVGCTLLDALIVGTLALVFMLIMKIPYAPLIASIVAITNILPTFGPMIGTGIGIFFLVLDKPLNALIFFIFMCVVQALDGMVLKPILFKDSLGIPAAWTLVLIIIGGKIAGIVGILLSIPFGAIFTIVYQETILPKLESRNEKINGGKPPEATPEPAPKDAKANEPESHTQL